MAELTSRDFIQAARKELATYLESMMNFSKDYRQEDETSGLIRYEAEGASTETVKDVFLSISAFSARANFFRSQTARSTDPKVVRFAEQELEPFIKELEFQFRVWSRYEAVLGREWEMTK